MAKVTFSTDIQSISGKLCSKEGVIYSVNKRTGKTFRSDRHGFTDKNSDEQKAVRNTFKVRSQAATTWWNSNKPSSENADGTEDYQKLMKLYKSQTKIGNPYSYMRTFVQDDGSVTIGTKRTAGGTSAGGSSSSGSSSGGDSIRDEEGL